MLARLGRAAARRPDREHDHRRGVVRRRRRWPAVRHGVRADAGIVPEPTGVRGVGRLPRLAVRRRSRSSGRPGHAEMAQPHWRDGGAVNAIEKMADRAGRDPRLREEWRGRSDQRHPHLSPGDIVPAIISGGEWAVTYPASCTLHQRADVPARQRRRRRLGYAGGARGRRSGSQRRAPPTRGWPSTRRRSNGAWTSRRTRSTQDTRWSTAMLDASAAVGEPSRWAVSTPGSTPPPSPASAARPASATGPRDIAWAHTIDEYVPVDDLVRCAQGLALAAIRYCDADA